ncbi:MAG: NAD-dependent dihydropyrimidine dehydrogenase subunit PreA [Anaerovoracaceae bacterium]|nr:NAD-dependent dihydropyrimidine dehydrogenase subunit PreA [Bacillota bacterium]MDY5975691.1 NAD-dependent dihydropyrimidine dehydrogenase subunit PreA [Anaerovoracaceae bacterium]
MAVKKDLSINYLGVDCMNPFFLSSSPVGGNYDMVAKCYETGWGGCFFKTVGIFVADECSPRFDQTNKEGLPWLGFKNMEQISDKPTEKNFEFMYRLNRDYPDHITVSTIMGSTVDEWKELAKMCEQAGAKLIEGNFSCPQMTSHDMGSDVGTNPELVKSYCEAVTSVTDIPFIAKMTPNNKNMEEPAIAAIQGGAASVSAINTIKSVTNIDFENMTAMPVVNGKSSISGYSGAAVKPIALRFITNLLQCEELKGRDISGIGGIETWRDAAEFLALGCKNIQVTTAIMQYGYRIVEDMISGMSHFMEERGYEKLDDFIGMALPNIIPAEELNRDFKILPKFDDDKCVGCGRCYVSCYDGGHQAIDFNTETRRPELNENCVGCHLCLNVCPVQECITPGEIVWKEGRTPVDIKFKKHYE